MYGLVNKGIEEMVIEFHGQDKWEEIKRKASFESEGFLNMKPYPDDLTYKLVGAACEVLNASAEDVLKAFGEYWILFTAEKGYGEMLNLAGSTLPDFLKNLDMLHGRVNNLMPELVPPQFECENETEHSIELIYKSKREGLIPMLHGLVTGLGKRFNKTTTFTFMHDIPDGGKKFLIEWN